jgi:hypothetical protein
MGDCLILMNVKFIEIPIPKPGPVLDLTSNQVLEPNGYFSIGIGGDLLVLDFKTGSILDKGQSR